MDIISVTFFLSGLHFLLSLDNGFLGGGGRGGTLQLESDPPTTTDNFPSLLI